MSHDYRHHPPANEMEAVPTTRGLSTFYNVPGQNDMENERQASTCDSLESRSKHSSGKTGSLSLNHDPQTLQRHLVVKVLKTLVKHKLIVSFIANYCLQISQQVCLLHYVTTESGSPYTGSSSCLVRHLWNEIEMLSVLEQVYDRATDNCSPSFI